MAKVKEIFDEDVPNWSNDYGKVTKIIIEMERGKIELPMEGAKKHSMGNDILYSDGKVEMNEVLECIPAEMVHFPSEVTVPPLKCNLCQKTLTAQKTVYDKDKQGETGLIFCKECAIKFRKGRK